MKRKKKEYLECAAFTVPSLFLVMLVFYIPFIMSLYLFPYRVELEISKISEVLSDWRILRNCSSGSISTHA